MKTHEESAMTQDLEKWPRRNSAPADPTGRATIKRVTKGPGDDVTVLVDQETGEPLTPEPEGPNEYYFIVKARNHRVLVTGTGYNRPQEAFKGIVATRTALERPVIDEEL